MHGNSNIKKNGHLLHGDSTSSCVVLCAHYYFPYHDQMSALIFFRLAHSLR